MRIDFGFIICRFINKVGIDSCRKLLYAKFFTSIFDILTLLSLANLQKKVHPFFTKTILKEKISNSLLGHGTTKRLWLTVDLNELMIHFPLPLALAPPNVLTLPLYLFHLLLVLVLQLHLLLFWTKSLPFCMTWRITWLSLSMVYTW